MANAAIGGEPETEIIRLFCMEMQYSLTKTTKIFKLVSDRFKQRERGGVMETIGAYEAKTHLPQLLKRVAKGERITITKHGVPVATLQAPAATASRPTREVIAELRKFRQKNNLNGISIHEMIGVGRR
jgi:prevent-host-death family protein